MINAMTQSTRYGVCHALAAVTFVFILKEIIPLEDFGSTVYMGCDLKWSGVFMSQVFHRNSCVTCTKGMNTCFWFSSSNVQFFKSFYQKQTKLRSHYFFGSGGFGLGFFLFEMLIGNIFILFRFLNQL